MAGSMPATKVRFCMGPGDNNVDLSRKHNMKAYDDSLTFLQASYTNLYSATTEETRKALPDLVQLGGG